MCAKFRFSISSRCDDIAAEVKGGNFTPPPQAAGGWRGGPAAAGLTTQNTHSLPGIIKPFLVCSNRNHITRNIGSANILTFFYRNLPASHHCKLALCFNENECNNKKTIPSAFSYYGQHARFFQRSSRTIRGRTAGGPTDPPHKSGAVKSRTRARVKSRASLRGMPHFGIFPSGTITPYIRGNELPVSRVTKSTFRR